MKEMTPHQSNRDPLSFLFVRRGNAWTAICLEYNISTQGKMLSEVREGLITAIRDTHDMSRELGVSFADQVQRAPQEFWDMFRDAESYEDYIVRVVARLCDDTESQVNERITELPELVEA